MIHEFCCWAFAPLVWAGKGPEAGRGKGEGGTSQTIHSHEKQASLGGAEHASSAAGPVRAVATEAACSWQHAVCSPANQCAPGCTSCRLPPRTARCACWRGRADCQRRGGTRKPLPQWSCCYRKRGGSQRTGGCGVRAGWELAGAWRPGRHTPQRTACSCKTAACNGKTAGWHITVLAERGSVAGHAFRPLFECSRRPRVHCQ